MNPTNSRIGEAWLLMATPWLINRLITPPITEIKTRCSSFWGLPLQKLN